MALSNYDTLAIDHEGHAINGRFTSPLGVTVAIYKNWLYVYDAEAWRAGGFTSPVVMEIQEGVVRYLDVVIRAVRGLQDGVFATVTSGYGAAFRGMIGCGVEAHDDDGKPVGVTPATLAWFRERAADDEETPLALAWALVFSDALRFNQGDAYFATRVGAAVPATRPGEPTPTVMSRILARGEGS